jgi:uncharacterized protein YeeX (DUF496 family)
MKPQLKLIVDNRTKTCLVDDEPDLITEELLADEVTEAIPARKAAWTDAVLDRIFPFRRR